jgi:microcystin-dependent protein
MAKTRRSYKGGAASTTIGTSIAASGATTFTIAAYTGWPYGSAPFFVVVEPGTSNEEKMLVTRTGSTDTTINIYSTPSVAANRGMDGTTSYLHASGSTVYPVFTATDADEANELASTLTTQGDILIHGASTFGRVGIGTAAQVLRVNSSATAPEWGQVATAGIADDAVTAAKIATGAVGADEIAANAVGASELADDAVDTAAIVNLAVTTGKLADGAVTTAKITDANVIASKLATDSVTTAKIVDANVTTAKILDSNVTTGKIADSNVTLAKLAAAVQNLLVPAGVIVSTLKSTADTGWIALNGTPVAGAQSAYPALYSATSGISGWWSGGTFTPPNMTNKMLEGVGATAVGQPGGSNTATLGVSNLPAHTHTTTLTNGSLVVRQDGAGDAKLTANSTYGPYNTYTISATTDGGGNGTATGDAVTVTNAHIAVYFQIKAH